MQDATQQTGQATGERTLTQLTSRGFFWMLMQTIGAKPLTLLGQLILAKLLLNEQWGLVGMAYSVSVWAELIQQAGLREILVRRHEQFDRWENPAFWFSLVTGAAATVFLLAAAPLAVWYYQAPQLSGLVYVLALSMPLNALAIVPDARLQVQLRYRAIAAIMFVTSLGSMALSIILAKVLPEHLGAYCFVWPFTIFAAVKSAAVWWLAPARVRLNPEWGIWKHLVGDSARLFVGSVFLWITNMIGVIVLGRLHDERVVGDFYFAFLISAQVSVLETNLQHVLLPSLSRLQNDVGRLRAAFLRAARGIELVGAPVAILMAAMADPGLRAVFADKWLGAIPALQTLGIGVAMRMTSLSSVALMKSAGRFNAFVLLYAVWSLVYAGLAVAGASMFAHPATGVALATMIFYTLLGPVNTFVAIRPLGAGWREVLGVFAAPMISAFVGIGGAMLLSELIPATPIRDWLRLGVIVVVGTPACFVLQCLLAPQTIAELLMQIEHMLRRSRRGLVAVRVTRRIAARVNPRCRLVFMPQDTASNT